MAGTLAGFPFWILRFDENGDPKDNGIATFLQELPSANLTDLLIFSHGWNNDEATAMDLYTRFFGEIRKLVDDPSVPKRPNAVIGVAGVIWPSILFPGDSRHRQRRRGQLHGWRSDGRSRNGAGEGLQQSRAAAARAGVAGHADGAVFRPGRTAGLPRQARGLDQRHGDIVHSGRPRVPGHYHNQRRGLDECSRRAIDAIGR